MNATRSTTFEPLESRQLFSAGDLDPTFGNAGKLVSDALPFKPAAIAVQRDGKVIAVGEFETDFALARVNPDGKLDVTFGDRGGLVTTDFGGNRGDHANGLTIQSDGRIVVVGSATFASSAGDVPNMAVARYNADGTPDTTFARTGKLMLPRLSGTGDVATAVAVQRDGRIIVVGTIEAGGVANNDFGVVALTHDGSLDAGFAGRGFRRVNFGTPDDRAKIVNITIDGRILVGGDDGERAGTDAGTQWQFLRLKPNGENDNTFDGDGMAVIPGMVNARLGAMAGRNDVYAVGESDQKFTLAHLLADGRPDLALGGVGRVLTDLPAGNDSARAVQLMARGRILVSGASGGDSAMVLYTAQGQIDTTFGNNGIVIQDLGAGDVITQTRLAPDGKILVAGSNDLGRIVQGRFQNFTPRVNVFATDDSATEGGDNALIKITRDDVYDFPTRVIFDLSGTATLGKDYSANLAFLLPLNAQVITRGFGPLGAFGQRVFVDIPAGVSFAEIPITAKADRVAEGSETIKLSLVASPAYAQDVSRSVVATIKDSPFRVASAVVPHAQTSLFSHRSIEDLLQLWP
jgi:uncharacterized delta-60 repeat protein